MDKMDFINTVQDILDECKDVETIKVRVKEMNDVVENLSAMEILRRTRN